MSLKLVSWNVKGLNVPEKHSSCLAELWRQRPQVAFLQETHFQADKIPKLHSKHFPTVYHSVSPSTKSKGTSILLAKTLPWQLLDLHTDREGRYLFVKGTLQSQMFTFANLYLPNVDQLPVLETCLSTLASFAEGTLVRGGDLNLTMDPRKDSSTGSSALSQRSRNQIRDLLHSHRLVDIWRILHPQERDYTFFSAVHGSYSRIDLFLVPHATIPLVSRAQIGHIALSDHAPISITLTLRQSSPRPATSPLFKTQRLKPML